MHTANGPQRQGGFCATGSDHREWDPAGAMIKVILGRGLFTLPSDTSHGRCGGRGKGSGQDVLLVSQPALPAGTWWSSSLRLSLSSS